MAYSAWSVVFGEQVSAAKWNILGTNDASFNTYIGSGTNGIQQVQYQETTALQTISTVIPVDDTIPQNTEGGQVLTKAITPKATTNLLVIDIAWFGAGGPSDHVTTALFQDSTANAIAAAGSWQQTSGGMFEHYLRHIMLAGTTSSTTFNVRIGPASAGTIYFNGKSGSRVFGGVASSTLKITEHKV